MAVRRPKATAPRLTWMVRGSLLVMAGLLATVFALAFWLKPYGPDGRPLRMETHRQMGLPPCTFYDYTGLPCPSCGMTTSFALLVRGDVWPSLKANAVGTLLAVFCLGLIPWALACALCGRLLGVSSAERAMTWVVAVLITLLLVRWVVVLAFVWICGYRY
jgi:hypothetical protein